MVTSFCLASRDRCVLRFQVSQEVGCHQHYAKQGRQWLEAKLANLCGDVQVDQATLYFDVFQVDQYRCLLVDVRGIRHGDEPTQMLQRWSFATECTLCGWAYPTPRHIMPNCMAEVLGTAKEGRIGAWGLQTAERPFQGVLIF